MRKKNKRHPKVEAGNRFGRLTVLERASKGGWWTCVCACGNKKDVPTGNLTCLRTQSCGCLHREWGKLLGSENVKHGLSNTAIYDIWLGIKDRCFNPKNQAYSRYGGRGITMCERWKCSVVAFVEDMVERPRGMSIERINNDGNYEPSNCKWATRTEQNNNSRRNRVVEFQGAKRTIGQWATLLGIGYGTIRMRLIHGWPLEKALTPEIYNRGGHIAKVR